MTSYGFAGQVLYVDLTSGKIRTEPSEISMAKEFLGGCGMGQKLLFDLLKPNTDPLAPENPVIISAGPLVGTLVPSSSKIQLTTKSATPANEEQTRYYVGLSSGGSNRFGMMMKNAGYDQIVITGRARKPVYVKITDDGVHLCDAEDLWERKDVIETTQELCRRHKNSGVIAIGKGGEKQITFALALVDNLNSIGRNGGATVMGSKNLKAIVVSGTKGIRVWDSRRLRSLSDRMCSELLESIPDQNRLKATALRPLSKKWSNLYPPKLSQDTLITMRGCSSCPHACKGIYMVKDGEYAGTQFTTNFFSHVSRYGIYMELTDYRHAMKLLDYLERKGICYVTALAMIRFITELREAGRISNGDVDGLELRMGDIESYLKLAEKLANREGIGDVMARGWHALGASLGVKEDDYEQGRGVIKGTSVIIGAQERMMPLLLETVVNPRGAMHQHPPMYFPNLSPDYLKGWCKDLSIPQDAIDRIFEKGGLHCGRFVRHVEDGEAVYFALGLCAKGIGAMFGYRGFDLIDEFYEAATGIKVTKEELKIAGERIWNLYKMLNVREGFSRIDDRFPKLWEESTKEPIRNFAFGELQLRNYDNSPVSHDYLQRALDEYYDERGWNVVTGIPTRDKLLDLGLGEICKGYY
jgi:aldehyde:ferredoxin oxidoreductase